MAFKIKYRQGMTTKTLVKALLVTVIALYVGGALMQQFGTAMMCTNSPFYTGFALVGWTVTSSAVGGDATLNATGVCLRGTNGIVDGTTYRNIITGTNTGGVLTVVGIVALAAVVTRVVQVHF